MSSTVYIALAIAIAAAATFLLRVLPFLVFGENRKTPELILYMGRVLPYAVMAMLVVYCLKDTNVLLVSNWAPRLIASALVAATYAWKRNSLLSIILGTACYMLLIQQVF